MYGESGEIRGAQAAELSTMDVARRPLNILILSACTSHKGGLEVMSLQVAEEMKRRGHNIFVAYRDKGDAFQSYNKIATASYEMSLGPFGFRKPFSAMELLAKLVKITKQQEVDICFSTNTGLSRTTGMLTLLTRVACVYHLGLYYGGPVRLDPFARWGLRRASAVIAPFSDVAASWRTVGLVDTQIEVWPNWTDADRFRRREPRERAEMKKRLGIAPETPVIVFVGRISAEKGIPTLLEAVGILNGAGLKPAVILAGHLDPSYRQTFAAMVDGSISSAIHMPGLINNPEDYYSISDIAVNPIVPWVREEPFGLTLIEAMSSELVTIASRGSNFPEILGEENSDLLFAPGSAQECAKHLKTWLLADESERAARGQKLRQRVINQYSSRNAEHYEKVFYRVSAVKNKQVLLKKYA